MTDQITDLEIKLAHAERVIDELSDIVAAQEKRLALLERQVAHLRDIASETGQSNSVVFTDDKPPHY